MLKHLIVLATLSVSIAQAGELTFITSAVNTATGQTYKAYIDQSTIHREGDYESVKLVSIYEHPITAAGFKGVKFMVNTFQMNCHRHVKRVTYIAFLDANEKVIVDKKYPDARDEPLGTNSVDRMVEPYLCIHLTDPVK